MFGAGVLTTLQQKPTVVPISIHFNDTLRLYFVCDFFSLIIRMQLQHNTKTVWIKLTKQYEGNGTVDDVLQQVWQFDDACLFFFCLSDVHISHCSTCLNSPSSFAFFLVFEKFPFHCVLQYLLHFDGRCVLRCSHTLLLAMLRSSSRWRSTTRVVTRVRHKVCSTTTQRLHALTSRHTLWDARSSDSLLCGFWSNHLAAPPGQTSTASFVRSHANTTVTLLHP
jgi:hypothetical protein